MHKQFLYFFPQSCTAKWTLRSRRNRAIILSANPRFPGHIAHSSTHCCKLVFIFVGPIRYQVIFVSVFSYLSPSSFAHVSNIVKSSTYCTKLVFIFFLKICMILNYFCSKDYQPFLRFHSVFIGPKSDHCLALSLFPSFC